MKAPTHTLKLIRREIERARKYGTMAVVHPDTLEGLLDTLEGLLDDNVALAELLHDMVSNITAELRIALASRPPEGRKGSKGKKPQVSFPRRRLNA